MTIWMKLFLEKQILLQLHDNVTVCKALFHVAYFSLVETLQASWHCFCPLGFEVEITVKPLDFGGKVQ